MDRAHPRLHVRIVVAAVLLGSVAACGAPPSGVEQGTVSPLPSSVLPSADLPSPTAPSWVPSEDASTDAAAEALLVPKGDVAIQDAGSDAWTPVAEEALLTAGDGVRTGEASSATVRFSDGSVARVNAETTLYLAQLSDGAAQQVSLELVTGEVWSRVQAIVPGGSYGVQTSTTLALVRGTEFNVAATDDGDTTVETIESAVEVATVELQEDGSSISSPQGTVTAGQSAAITRAMVQELARERATLRATGGDPRAPLPVKAFALRAIAQERRERAWLRENARDFPIAPIELTPEQRLKLRRALELRRLAALQRSALPPPTVAPPSSTAPATSFDVQRFVTAVRALSPEEIRARLALLTPEQRLLAFRALTAAGVQLEPPPPTTAEPPPSSLPPPSVRPISRVRRS